MAKSKDPIFVDNSILKAVAKCSTQALMQYGFGYQPVTEAAPLKAGEAAHAAMAAWYRGEGKIAAMAEFERMYEEWARDHVPPDDRLAYDNCALILDYWFETHPMEKLPYRVDPNLVEVGFQWPLTDEGDIVFCGRIDLIFLDDAKLGGWHITDHKFKGRITQQWIKQLRLDSQLSGYIWAAQQHTHEPVNSALVNAIQFRTVPSSKTRCKDHGVPYEECGLQHVDMKLIGPIQRTPEQIEEWKKGAIHLAKKYRELIEKYPQVEMIQRVRMQGAFHDACQFCGCYDWCVVGRPVGKVDSFFRIEPWEPRTFAEGKLTNQR